MFRSAFPQLLYYAFVCEHTLFSQNHQPAKKKAAHSYMIVICTMSCTRPFSGAFYHSNSLKKFSRSLKAEVRGVHWLPLVVLTSASDEAPSCDH